MRPFPVSMLALGLALGGMAASAHAAEAIKIPASVPYAADNDIAGNIKRECKLNEQLGQFIGEYARQKNLSVQSVDSTSAGTKGRALVVEIKDAVSSGNAWTGHSKATSVRGSLYENGRKVASFRGMRHSMGGAFAGYKGSCSVLGRTVKILGQDIAGWLANPQDGAELGDLK